MGDEQWVELPDFPGYRVSTFGRIQSRRKRGPAKSLSETWRPIKPKRRRATGYLHVVLSDGSRAVTTTVHRLVAIAFLGPPEGHKLVRHLNGERDDNRLINLAWGTPKENAADAMVHRLGNVGERMPGAKLTNAQVLEIRAKAETMGEGRVTRLAREYGVSLATISNIIRGRRWRQAAIPQDVPAYLEQPEDGPKREAFVGCEWILSTLSPAARQQVLSKLLARFPAVGS